jgi:hypothetical protein
MATPSTHEMCGLPALGFVAEGMIQQDKRGHGFHHDHGAWEDTRIMATAAFQRGVAIFDVDRLLFEHDGGNRFEGDAEVDGLAVGDATLNPAGTI